MKNNIGDWGLGIGDWGLGPIPNPQSPIPNPHFNFYSIKLYNYTNINYFSLTFFLINYFSESYAILTNFLNQNLILLLQYLYLKLEMNRYIFAFICLFLIDQELAFPSPVSSGRSAIFLPMKKDHKYGDDICYYREINEKLDYAVYYVKPCEKGKYCEDEVSSNQPFGFCRDIETNVTDFPSFGDTCGTNGECQDDLICDSTCKKECNSPLGGITYTQIQNDYNTFSCRPSDYKQFDDTKFCHWYEVRYEDSDPKTYIAPNPLTPYLGKFPGLPKECGIIRYKTIPDVNPNTSPYSSYTRYVVEGKEWCSIGEAKDGDFVTNSRFCKSGFSLRFYPNGDLVDPSKGLHSIYTENTEEMCVTPTQLDKNNPLVGCIITYKIGDGSEHKYNVYKYYNSEPSSKCDKDVIIKSQIYSQFIDEFNNATDEDKKNCYLIPRAAFITGYTGNLGDCQNIKLLQLFYFYNHVKEYLFYKDRKDLEKVLHFKIQQTYHRYYEFSSYLNLNYLFFFLILILL